MVQATVETEAETDYAEVLRDYGWKIKFTHNRTMLNEPLKHNFPLAEFRMSAAQNLIAPFGGSTICSAKKTIDGHMIEVRAEAKCNTHDKYVKKVGNRLAARRLWEFIADFED